MARQLSKLNVKNTLFLLCDIQEKFRPGMKHFDGIIENANKLVQAGKALEIPLICTEQYPEKLGNTVKEIDICHAACVQPKTKFSMVLPEVEAKIKELFPQQPKDVVLFGAEFHVCVEQTAIDLVERGYKVHIVADATCSRLDFDRDLAIERLRQLGCFIATSESVIFSLLQDKNHPKFDVIRKLVAKPSADVGLSGSASKL